MKLNRLPIACLLGFSLLTTSALACDHSSQSSSSSEESHWSFLGWCHHFTESSDDHHRECDQDGQNSGTGNNCDRGKGNDGGHCSVGGSTTSGGSGSGGSTGGSTTAGGGKGIS